MNWEISVFFFFVFFDCRRVVGLKLTKFDLVVQKARIQIWLFEQKDLRIEGRIIVSS